MINKFKVGSPLWLKFREQFVTATEVASLLGVNSYMTASQLYNSKMNPSSINNQYLRDGKILEPAVVQALQIDLGMDISAPCEAGYTLIFSDPVNRISSTPDAFYWGPGEPAVVECKTTSVENFEKNWRAGNPPLRYLTQILVQMYTVGMQEGYLACIAIRPNIPLAVYKIQYSKDFEKLMFKRVSEFWAAAEIGKTITTTKAVREKATEILKAATTLVGFYEFQNADKSFDELDLNNLF